MLFIAYININIYCRDILHLIVKIHLLLKIGAFVLVYEKGDCTQDNGLHYDTARLEI
jgi:hypothetical protein